MSGNEAISDLHEMQYKYLYMQAIQGPDKRDFSETLATIDRLDYFNLEPIQMIIDYKWETYGRKFYLHEFYLFTVYVFLFILDLDKLRHFETNEEGQVVRVRTWWFYFRKFACIAIQCKFLFHEIRQLM